jgi:hypothetical protein
MRPLFASAAILVGLVLFALVVAVAAVGALAFPLLAAGGGLVGCGCAGLYCWRQRRTGRK